MSKPKYKIGDIVRILDGSKIKGYNAGWARVMDEYVGTSATVRRVDPWYTDDGGFVYQLTGVDGVEFYSWDERGLELVGDAGNHVVIYRSGRSVYAHDLTTGRIEKAKCSPEDEFDFYKGAALALDRLFDREEPKQQEPKLYNGKVVCVERGPGELGVLEVVGYYWWTVGKVYDVVDGMILDDDGDPHCKIKSLEELNEREDKYAKFVALVE